MYKLIGGDRNEYGPVSAEVLRQWILEGRASRQSLVRAEGDTEWTPLAALPEFADALRAREAVAAAEVRSRLASVLPSDLLVRDWHVDLGRCISQGVDLFRGNFGVLFGGGVVYLGIELAIGLMSAIPILGWVFTIANLIVAGPLLGGLYGLFLKTIRAQPAVVDGVFDGFRECFLHLFLANLLVGLLTGLSALPGILLAVPVVVVIAEAGDPTIWHFGLLAAAALVALVPATYLGVSWTFTLPLVMDKRLDFWSAMETSRRVVGQHWWTLFGFLFVIWLLNVLGMLVCCVGVLFTMPVAFAAMLYAYEEVFTRPTPAA